MCRNVFYYLIGYDILQQFPVCFIDGTTLIWKQETADSGVLISDDLNFQDQVKKACAEASRGMNITGRSFKSRSSTFLSNMYKMFARLHMEYCVQVWNPVYTGEITRMEKEQNRFTRIMRQGRVMPPGERNNLLGISSHEDRQLRGDLIHMYRPDGNPNFFRRMKRKRYKTGGSTYI